MTWLLILDLPVGHGVHLPTHTETERILQYPKCVSASFVTYCSMLHFGVFPEPKSIADMFN